MKKTLLLPLFLISMALWLANCTQSGPCTGSLTLENPIPDITIAVDDTVFIDLTNPPVFVSSEGRVTYAYSAVSGTLNANLKIIENPHDNGNFTLLLVMGKEEGERVVELIAASDCLENSQLLIITVIES